MRFVALASLLTTGAAACYADYARGRDDPSYGAPNSLQGEQPPGPGIAGGGGGGDGGTGESAPLACGDAVDGGACTVKYGERIAPLMAAAGPLKCASTSCHGGSQTPIMAPQAGEDATPKSIYDSMLRNANGKPYLNGCSYDPNASTFWAQSLLLHEGAGRFTLGGADRTDFEAWLKCGAPEN